MLTHRKKKKIIDEYGEHATDTGSASVQVALLSKQIDELTAHLKKNPKDQHSRRGLLNMVSKRRRLLKYLEKNSSRAYNAIIKKLGLKR